MATQQDSVYEISSFIGLSDWEDRGIKGSFKFAANADVRKEVDSLSCQQALIDIGLHSSHSPSSSVSPSVSASLSPSLSNSSSASPSTRESNSPSLTPSASASLSPSATKSSSISSSPSPTAGLNTVFQDLVRFWVRASDGYTYGFGNTGYIYRIDSDFVVQVVYKDADGEIKGAAEWYNDSGKAFLFWATDHKLNRKEIPGLSNWNDVNVGDSYPKINLKNNVPHTMSISGGSLLICNGAWMALVGYDNSYTNEAVDLIPGNISKTLLERDGRAIIGTYREGDVDNAINAMIDSEVPLSQVGEDGDIYYSDMNNSIPVKRFPGGGKCNPGGVVNQVNQVSYFQWEQNSLSWDAKKAVGNLALFGVFGATSGKNGIYSYGRKNKNKPFVLNLDYAMDVDEIGALANINGTIIASYRDGSAFGTVKVDPDTKATTIYEGLDFKAPTKLPEGVTVFKYIELFMKNLPVGCSVQFFYRMNKNGEFRQAKTAGDQDSYTITGGKKATFKIQEAGDIYEPRLVLIPNLNVGPEIYRARTYFQ